MCIRDSCIIVCIGKNQEFKDKDLFLNTGERLKVENINGYLLNGKDIFINYQKKPISFKSEIKFGSMPRDGGFFILTTEEKEELEKLYPICKPWIRKYIGAKEFIERTNRWVLWLKGVGISDIRKCPKIIERIENVRKFREASKASGTRKYASTPTIFCQIAQPEIGNYIAVPRVTSEKREYIPIGFMDSSIIASDLIFIIPEASLIEFSLLTSSTHMKWVKTVAGRMKSDYRYAKDIVYNTFPIPNLDDKTREKLEKTGQKILDIREKYPSYSYADLYDPLFMPADLRKAHQENDRAVWEAYGKKWELGNEEECVAYLMKLYKDLVEK